MRLADLTTFACILLISDPAASLPQRIRVAPLPIPLSSSSQYAQRNGKIHTQTKTISGYVFQTGFENTTGLETKYSTSLTYSKAKKGDGDKKKPTSVCLQFPPSAMDVSPGPPGFSTMFLDLPDLDGVPFKSIGFNVNPMGHPGGLTVENEAASRVLLAQWEKSQKIEDLINLVQFVVTHSAWLTKHVDVHFYLLPVAAVQNIGKGCTFDPSVYPLTNCTAASDKERARLLNALPGADYLPKDPRHGPTPLLPLHKLHPRTLGHHPVIIYGGYDGKVAFIEPMMAATVLEGVRATGKRVAEVVPAPKKVREDAWWPRSFQIGWDEGS
ncbi:hypothetical protein HK104_003971 [Borealophlyctis nickersoniae]|nr:hypothetical protein HK104_003971 [Borealophlyctis nickersoniae]